jgi:cell division protein FtsW
MPRAAASRTAAASRPKPPRRQQPLEYNILLTATLCLMAAGAVMVYSASSAPSLLRGHGDGSDYLVRYVGYGAVGFLGLHLLARHGLRSVVRLTGPLLALAFLMLLAVKVPGVGVEINGARRWLGAGPLQFQPSEVMKLALVLYSVRLLAERPTIVGRPRQLVPLALVVGGALLLVASQPDLGTALVIAFTTSAILVAAGIPLRHLAAVAATGVVLVAIYALMEPYRRARLTAFMDPWADAGGTGFQIVQGEIALGSGGLFGKGVGESTGKNFYVPEAHTDFILTIIGEEVGLIGITCVLFLYGLLAYAGLRVAKNARGRYAKLLAAGLTSLILCQACLNAFAVMGLLPLTGVPLPFVSYGSTNLIVLLAAVGLLLNIAAGGSAHLRAVPDPRRTSGSRNDDRGHRSRRDGGARGARAGGRRRAAG